MKRNIQRGVDTLMTSGVRAEIAASLKLAIQKGYEKNEEWMLKEYTAAPFLFGAACDERHRLGAAQRIVRAAGYGQRLDAAMTAVKLAAAPTLASSCMRACICKRACVRARKYASLCACVCTLVYVYVYAYTPTVSTHVIKTHRRGLRCTCSQG